MQDSTWLSTSNPAKLVKVADGVPATRLSSPKSSHETISYAVTSEDASRYLKTTQISRMQVVES
jgi:hypothetical protein